jgi:hypothetical protein
VASRLAQPGGNGERVAYLVDAMVFVRLPD